MNFTIRGFYHRKDILSEIIDLTFLIYETFNVDKLSFFFFGVLYSSTKKGEGTFPYMNTLDKSSRPIFSPS